jgi:hypothetical protein
VQQYLTIWDLLLSPFYLAVLIFIAKRIRDKKYPVGHPLRPYYLPGLYVKFAGAIFIALIYQYYYGFGDTFNYLIHARVINSSFLDSPILWVKLLLGVSPEEDPYIYTYSSQMMWYGEPATYTVSVIAALFGLLNGTTYIPIALLFAFFSYTGTWAMYRTFVGIYPKMHKYLAYSFLFIPSTFVWGSAIFKDTICMFGLGWLTYTTFRIFINKDFSFKNLFLLVISFYLIGVIKVYILLAFIPALVMWLLLTYSHKIKPVAFRVLVNLAFVALVIAAFLFASAKFKDELNRYSLEKVAATSAVTRGWITFASGDEGSTYDLGEFEPTPVGMLSKFPAAVVVTLFRPFLWESKKLIILFSALESLIFTSLTILAFKRNGLRIFKKILSDPTLLFCIVFTLIFAFAVGISSFNFGALSRYKIPCLPFFGSLLMILLYRDNKELNTKPGVKKKKVLETSVL